VFTYNQFLASLGAGAAVGFRELYSFSIIWKVITNMLLFYPLSFVFKLLPEDEKAL
jgi:hypothetical protein